MIRRLVEIQPDCYEVRRERIGMEMSEFQFFVHLWTSDFFDKAGRENILFCSPLFFSFVISDSIFFFENVYVLK